MTVRGRHEALAKRAKKLGQRAPRNNATIKSRSHFGFDLNVRLVVSQVSARAQAPRLTFWRRVADWLILRVP